MTEHFLCMVSTRPGPMVNRPKVRTGEPSMIQLGIIRNNMRNEDQDLRIISSKRFKPAPLPWH